MEEKSESHLLTITTEDIETSFQTLSTDLNDKIFLFTKKYWRYVYIDRFLKIIILISSMMSVMLLSFEIIDNDVHNQSDMYTLYTVYILCIINLIYIMTLLLFKVSDKCVYYSTIRKLYHNMSIELRKILIKPMNKIEYQHAYENVILQVNTVEQFESSYKVV